MEVIYEDYVFDIDIEKTEEFYANYAYPNKDLIYENYIQNIDSLKELTEFLEKFGIDSRNPVEVDGNGNFKGMTDYELIFVVYGEIISHPSYEIAVGKSNIAYYTNKNSVKFTDEALYNDLVEPVIILDVFEVIIPWSMEIDYDTVNPKITKKGFLGE